jgi:hypothetical protein
MGGKRHQNRSRGRGRDLHETDDFVGADAFWLPALERFMKERLDALPPNGIHG